MGTKSERELPRVGHVARPDRAWEIWNQNYHRGDPDPNYKVFDEPAPWVAYHPKHGAYEDLPTVEAAIQVAVSFE